MFPIAKSNNHKFRFFEENQNKKKFGPNYLKNHKEHVVFMQELAS
jgi:hypothetical protein